jgi:hypothetical protein
MERGEFAISGQVAQEAQIEGSLREIFGNNIAFHHTVLREDLGMTYGGLHATREGAVKARDKIIAKIKKSAWSGRETDNGRRVGFSQSQVDENASKWEGQSEVVKLEEGEEYSPGEDIPYTRIHGETDGEHGSERSRSNKSFFSQCL